MTGLFYLLLLTAAPVVASALCHMVAGTRLEQVLAALIPEGGDR